MNAKQALGALEDFLKYQIPFMASKQVSENVKQKMRDLRTVAILTFNTEIRKGATPSEALQKAKDEHDALQKSQNGGKRKIKARKTRRTKHKRRRTYRK